MKTVILSEETAILVHQLLDIAIKAGGKPNAEIALPIMLDIEKQLAPVDIVK